MIRTLCTTLILLCFCWQSFAQFEFKGSVDATQWNGQVYLSVIEDYRKLTGVHSEQVLMQTPIKPDGSFKFSGNNLDLNNKFYRLHVDACEEQQQGANHFTGHCINSKSVAFIANNQDTIAFPLSFEAQIFCDISATNQVAASLLKVDSLQEAMRYEFTDLNSAAKRKAGMQRWFTQLHEFGKAQKEPLVELYIHAGLTNRATNFYDFYQEDVLNNNYYNALAERLKDKYPNSSYSLQFQRELTADLLPLTNLDSDSKNWIPIASLLLLVLLLANMIYWGRKRFLAKRRAPKTQLTPQEQKIVDLILENKTNKEIAAQIFVSHSTVKTHINNLYRKLNLQNREQLKSLYRK